MTYATLMVHLEAGGPNTAVLRAARHLARMFDSSVIGIAACQPMVIDYAEGRYSGDAIAGDRAEIDSEMGAVEARFRSALGDHHGLTSWRSATTTEGLADFVADEARCADMIVTGATRATFSDTARCMNLSDLVLKAGRPVLVVPAAFEQLTFDRVMLAWTDTREARRAAIDALPFLKRANRVEIVEIAAVGDLPAAARRLDDVAAWLERHGVSAGVHGRAAKGAHAIQLAAIAKELSMNLIVAGAFGHGRLREWAMGGVTEDLLLGGEHSTLLSH